MKFKEIKIAKSVLSKEIGWSWPLFLIKCLIRKNDIFNNTHWSKVKGAESKFVKRLPIVSAVYLELQNKFNKEKAFDIMRKINIPIGLNESLTIFRSLKISRKNPLELLKDYLDLVDEKGAGRFCNREYSEKNIDICHRVVTKCPLHGFFSEAETPELTKLFCEVDKEFYAKAFPDLKFHRGSSWENTIAYGKDHCEFIFEKNK
jgi:hypothetical protein